MHLFKEQSSSCFLSIDDDDDAGDDGGSSVRKHDMFVLSVICAGV